MPKKPAVNREDKRKKEYLESSQDFLKHEKEEFKQYSIFLKDVNTAIEENQDKFLGSAGIARLKKSYEQAMDFTHNLISKKDKNVPDYHYSAIQKTLKALSKDYKALLSYEKKINEGKLTAPLTFNDILENSRSKPIIAKGDITTAGAGQNTRYVVQTEDKKVFFTKSERGQSYADDIKDLKKRMIDKYGVLAGFLNNSYVTMTAGIITKEKNFDDRHLSNAIYSTDENVTYYIGIASKNSNSPAALLGFSEMSNVIQKKIFQEYLAERFKIELAHEFKAVEGINPECKQNKRNAAQSMVSDMIGRKDLLAYSENVKLKVPGKSGSINGTAMDAAKGEDLMHIDSNSNYLKIEEGDVEKSASLKRDIADLQVLDFLVGNPDRHTLNVTYRFDENGKICGIMGIDNDTCFGANYTADGLNFRSVGPEDMKIITASAAKKILALDENTFRNSLYGFDLTVQEVDAAVERLKTMKKVIKDSVKRYEGEKIPEGKLIEGLPRIVEEKDLDKYSFEKDLCSLKVEKKQGKTINYGNMFASLYLQLNNKKNIIGNVRSSNFKRLEEMSENLLTATGKMVDVKKKMNDMNGWYHFGSTQFDDMIEKINKALILAGKGEAPLFNPVKDYEKNTPCHMKDYELSEFGRKYKQKVKEALDATNKYLDERAAKNKDVLKKKTKSAGWKRYQYALENKENLEKALEKIEKAEKALEDNKIITRDEPKLLAGSKKQKTNDKIALK